MTTPHNYTKCEIIWQQQNGDESSTTFVYKNEQQIA